MKNVKQIIVKGEEITLIDTNDREEKICMDVTCVNTSTKIVQKFYQDRYEIFPYTENPYTGFQKNVGNVNVGCRAIFIFPCYKVEF